MIDLTPFRLSAVLPPPSARDVPQRPAPVPTASTTPGLPIGMGQTRSSSIARPMPNKLKSVGLITLIEEQPTTSLYFLKLRRCSGYGPGRRGPGGDDTGAGTDPRGIARPRAGVRCSSPGGNGQRRGARRRGCPDSTGSTRSPGAGGWDLGRGINLDPRATTLPARDPRGRGRARPGDVGVGIVPPDRCHDGVRSTDWPGRFPKLGSKISERGRGHFLRA